LLDLNSGKERFRHDFGQTHPLISASISPDGELFAIAVDQKKIAVRLRKDWTVAFELPGWGPLVFSSDGRLVASFDEADVIRVWSHSGQPCTQMKGRALEFSRDGRMFAVASSDASIMLCESATGKLRLKLTGHEHPASAFCFGSRNDVLASGAVDSAAIVWDLRPREVRKPSAGEFDALWEQLAAMDASKAYTSLMNLVAAGDAAVPYILKRMQEKPAGESVSRLIRELDDDDVQVRNRAAQQLSLIGPPVQPEFQKVLQARPSAELRERLQILLKEMDGSIVTSIGAVRRIRALEILERIGSREAHNALSELARQAAWEREREDARSSCRRLDGRAR
jgi:hypothetical protein